MEEKKRTTWDIVNSIFKKDFIPTDEELKSMSSFMLCRTLSNHPLGVEVANFINCNHTLDIKLQYWLARSALQSVKFIGYPKKDKEENKNIEYIMLEYNCSDIVAKRYLSLLPQEELERIKEKNIHYGRIKA